MNNFISKMIIICLLATFSTIVKAQNFELIRTFNGHKKAVSYVTFRSEDNLLISGDERGEIILWEAMSGKIKKRVKQHSGKITHLAFSNKGKYLVSASYDGTIKVWDLKNMRVVKAFKNTSTESYDGVEGNEPTFALFSPDDKYVYYGGYNLAIARGQIKSGKVEQIYQNEEYGITCGIVSPNQKNLVFAAGGSIHFLDFKSKKITTSLFKSDEYEDYICELAFMPNSNLLAAWAVDGHLHFWDWKNKALQYGLEATNREGSSDIAFSENGKYLVTGNFVSNTKLWNTQKKEVVQLLEEHESPVVTFDFSMDGKYIITGSEDNSVKLWTEPTTEKPEITKNTKLPEKLEDRIVETQKVIHVTNREIELVIWDNRKIDDDVVSVNLNGKWVLKDYMLTAERRKLQLSLNKKDNHIIIHAHNEGKIPPNTIAVRLKDGEKETFFTLKSTMGTSAALEIILD